MSSKQNVKRRYDSVWSEIVRRSQDHQRTLFPRTGERKVRIIKEIKRKLDEKIVRPVSRSRYISGAVGRVGNNFVQAPKRVDPPLLLQEVMELPSGDRKELLAERLEVEVEQLFEKLLSIRKKKSILAKERPFEKLFFGFGEQGELTGPTSKRMDGIEQYAVTIDRHHLAKKNYHGRLPYPLMELGDKWILLQCPTSTSEEEPTLWDAAGSPVTKYGDEANSRIATFIDAICQFYSLFGQLELPNRIGGKVTISVLEDTIGKLGEKEFGLRLREKLGVYLIEGDKSNKRWKMFNRSYHARGEIPMSQIQVVRLEQVPFPARFVSDEEIKACRHIHAKTILKIQQQFWKNGYRFHPDLVRESDHSEQVIEYKKYLVKRFEISLDGGIYLADSFFDHSVERMRSDQQELGIDEFLIRECAKTKQASFRGLLPGSGQLKGMGQRTSWLPSGYLLFHSTNDKTKEIFVSADQPFRYYWDAFKGKKDARVNLQYICANPFLFPRTLLDKWFLQMCEDHLHLLEERGVIDDREELIELRFGNHDGEDGNGLHDSFNTFSRTMITDLAQYLDVREFPKLVTNAARAATENWVNNRDGKLRISAPGVHYQLISQLAMMIIDPETERVENERSGVRFSKSHRLAYQSDLLYQKSMIDHGGADADDYYDFIFFRDEGKTVVVRLRSPCEPGLWGIDVLEGEIPEDVDEKRVEEIPLSVKKGIVREWGRRAHLLPPVKDLVLPIVKQEEEEDPRPIQSSVKLYGWSKLLREIHMVSIHPGLLVNLVSMTWKDRDYFFTNRVCPMEKIIDWCTQEGAKYGEEGLGELQRVIVEFFEKWFRSKPLDSKLFDFGQMMRKGVHSLFCTKKEWKIANAIEAGAKLRPDHFTYSNTIEHFSRRLREFQQEFREYIDRLFFGMEEKAKQFSEFMKTYDSDKTGVVTYLNHYAEFSDCHWVAREGWKFQRYLREAMIECGHPPLDKLPHLDALVFDLQARATKKDIHWDLKKQGEIFPVGDEYNYKWKSSRIKDGLKTKCGRHPLAQKISRTGLGLISKTEIDKRPELESGKFLAQTLYHCLSTYTTDNSKHLRVEDFLLEEENFNRFMVWLMMEFEVVS